MEPVYPLLGFVLGDQRYALPLAAVERVVRAVAITSLPGAPDIVSGIVDLKGRIVPVLDIRCRFLLPPREIALSDPFIVARTARRAVVIVADSVAPVREYSSRAITAADAVLPGLPWVRGVAKLPDGLMVINDLDNFLSLEEDAQLAASLGEAPHE